MAMPKALQATIIVGIFFSIVAGQNCGCASHLCCCRFGYCGSGDNYCGTGCQSGPCNQTSTPNNNVSVASIVSDKFFNGIINQVDVTCPGKNFYSRIAFLNALTSFPQFATFGYEEDIRREIAAFFAHVTRQTRHLCYIEEVDGSSKDYCDARSTQYTCVPGKHYHGRGAMQLAWNFNYGPAGESIGFDGLNAPETVSSDPVVAFKTALWFWTNKVQPVLGQGFGATTRAINGALECDGASPTAVQARIDYYADFCNQLGVAPGDNLTC